MEFSIGWMLGVAVSLAIFWGVFIEVAKAMIFKWVGKQDWWLQNAVKPQTAMMFNFGYPKEPSPAFPKGVTEPMARDAYTFIVTICFQHAMSALVMVPLVVTGYDKASDLTKVLFVLGTLSDVGFDIYDWSTSTLKAWFPATAKKFGYEQLPFPFWVIICCLHHPLAMIMIIPMNLKYLSMPEYHITCVSLLFAAAVCYSTGSYKFTLDVKTTSGFYQYKVIVIIQLFIVLYTRLYLWFPSIYRMTLHFYAAEDYLYLIVGGLIGAMMSLFNVILVSDAVGAALKWLPKTLPKTEDDHDDLLKSFVRQQSSRGTIPPQLFIAASDHWHKRTFKAAVDTVIATNRMAKASSSGSKQNKQS